MANHDSDGSTGTSWREYRRLVLAELNRSKDVDLAHDKELAKIRTDITILKSKASMLGAIWGFCGGILAATIAGLIVYSLTGTTP